MNTKNESNQLGYKSILFPIWNPHCIQKRILKWSETKSSYHTLSYIEAIFQVTFYFPFLSFSFPPECTRHKSAEIQTWVTKSNLYNTRYIFRFRDLNILRNIFLCNCSLLHNGFICYKETIIAGKQKIIFMEF